MSHKKIDQSVNILKKREEKLDKIFYPKSIALIGASEKENSVGRTIFENLLNPEFKGTIYPVNPKRETVLNKKAFKSIKDIDEEIDLAVIATKASIVPKIIEECGIANVKAAIIISAGFKELGEPGIKLEKEIEKIALKYKIKIVGPNCLGIMNPLTGLNATFAAGNALKGNVAFLSQSGALCTAVLDWSQKEKVGFSSFVSVGSMMDVKWNDLINYFGNDPNTKSILIYMESIGNPRLFLSAAKEVALTKPIILIKAGKTKESAKAAVSHTGALAGSDDVLNAALKRVGVLRVDTISELFNMAEILAKQPLPKGPNLSIVTNAGGPGVIATDALIENGARLTELSDETKQKLNQFLPPEWSHNNPIDIIGDASPKRYFDTLNVMTKDEKTDGLLVILTPQNMTDPTAVANELIKFSNVDNKPILASWMGAYSVKEGWNLLTEKNIPVFEYPDAACKTFANMYRYYDNLLSLYETPIVKEFNWEERKQKNDYITNILNKAKNEKRSVLNEDESKKILDKFGIPTALTYIAKNENEAVFYAEKISYPVVLKVFSKTITHKKDVGGVKLNLDNSEEVRNAYKEIYENVKKRVGIEHFQGVTVQPMINLENGYEVILGSSIDNLFGPVLLFGSGGSLVEIYKDKALGLPPLNSTLAGRIMQQTKIYKAFKGIRGEKAVDIQLLNEIFVKFSNLVVSFPEIKEIDINPLFVSANKIIALDARIVLLKEDEKAPPLAIRPYPEMYIEKVEIEDGSRINIRPIRPEDEPMIISFIKDLSKETILKRYLKSYNIDELIAKERLIQLCFIDYDREIALIAEMNGEILGVSRLIKNLNSTSADFSIVVKDKWHKKGIGTKLLHSIIKIAKNENIESIYAQISKENIDMQNLLKKAGFELILNNNKFIAGYTIK